MGELLGHAHGTQHMRGLDLAGGAGAPELTATPARSSPITNVSAFVPGTAMQLVLGNRSTPAESTTASGAIAKRTLLQLVSQYRHHSRLG